MKPRHGIIEHAFAALNVVLAMGISVASMGYAEQGYAAERTTPRNEKRMRQVLRKDIEKNLQSADYLWPGHTEGYVIVFCTTVREIKTTDGTSRTINTTTYSAQAFAQRDSAVKGILDFVTQAKGSEKRSWYCFGSFSYEASERGLRNAEKSLPQIFAEAEAGAARRESP